MAVPAKVALRAAIERMGYRIIIILIYEYENNDDSALVKAL
ncbi:hypothetical protein [uncultured Sphingomonas sp.]|nr:hypothetical protein [uncultured Sphingomonas sp.]